jgi:hypothetical protein
MKIYAEGMKTTNQPPCARCHRDVKNLWTFARLRTASNQALPLTILNSGFLDDDEMVWCITCVETILLELQDAAKLRKMA